ncbi:amidohydrolase family protein [Maribacter aurantiacus]|uniref:Amidohydrolase n=1 Tax=Maribacter aurantiacus TaxID=1882343 RepID=A0A5R8M8D7_9FLAO|nr:amidohydrolase family protein [Maribacter aurantiacus]TLF45832.1 amidohydrolase [Maribacter aurantiacus]
MKRIILLLCLSFGFFSSSAQGDILLKDYRPKTIHNVQKTEITKAKFTAIDVHSHPYAANDEEIGQWVKTMDARGIEKTIILTYQTGKKFDSIYKAYSKYGDRFEIWCGFDYSGYGEKGYVQKAIKELERCFKVGAKGVGELGDKGLGMANSGPTPAPGMHFNDERMQPLLKRCGELGMPVNIHVAEPIWMYEPIDVHNDGLMNAATWKIDTANPNVLSHAELLKTLEEAVANNPGTTFIACHYANCGYDLSLLGQMFDQYPNLYADISARYAEVAPVPRATSAFFKKYQDRLLYGTDMGMDDSMYQTTFRILETADEHFYEHELFSYHWPLNGLNLDEDTLRKVYSENARKILK